MRPVEAKPLTAIGRRRQQPPARLSTPAGPAVSGDDKMSDTGALEYAKMLKEMLPAEMHELLNSLTIVTAKMDAVTSAFVRAGQAVDDLASMTESFPNPTPAMMPVLASLRAYLEAAARRLLAEGANPSDRLETWRNGKLSMSGTVGECAKWEVVDDGGLRLRKYVPRHSTSRSVAAVPGLPGTWVAEQSLVDFKAAGVHQGLATRTYGG